MRKLLSVVLMLSMLLLPTASWAQERPTKADGVEKSRLLGEPIMINKIMQDGPINPNDLTWSGPPPGAQMFVGPWIMWLSRFMQQYGGCLYEWWQGFSAEPVLYMCFYTAIGITVYSLYNICQEKNCQTGESVFCIQVEVWVDDDAPYGYDPVWIDNDYYQQYWCGYPPAPVTKTP